MTDDGQLSHRQRDFRLNFEQQQKRAKELLRAARAGDAAALARFSAPPKLAEAQHLIARELRFENWAALKHHIADMTRAREAMHASVLDAEMRTLHVRCGSDIMQSLREAGLHGDFYAHDYPYLMGPVREGAGALQERAQFIVDCYGEWFEPPLQSLGQEAAVDGQRRALEEQERQLVDSAGYERVVLWFEHDTYDQLALVRLLSHYATQRRPAHLELINIGDFPGGRRFIGLGELPPEALRMLWGTRRAISSAQLRLGLDTWRALIQPDPRALAVIMRSRTPALPLLAPALRRHLQELPSTFNGLSLTEQMALSLLANEPTKLMRLIGMILFVTDPLPGQGDWNACRRVLQMEAVESPLFTRTPGAAAEGSARSPWSDLLTITATGRAVLTGEVDFRSLHPPTRWVGGVAIASGNPDWRWDEELQDVVCR